MSNNPSPTAQYTAKRFDRKTRVIVNPVVAEVGLTATLVLRNNPNRIYWHITNHGGVNIYITPFANQSLLTGLVVPSGGGYLLFEIDAEGESIINEVWAVCGAAATPIYVLEGVME